MHEVVSYLNKRRNMMMGIVAFLGIFAVVVSFTLQIPQAKYFGGKYNNIFIYSLIVYKLIELPILYYLLVHRHIVALRLNINTAERLLKFRKHAKLLLFLIPQGNTIFGIIAYRLSGNVFYFLLFSSIAIITLYLIKPNKFKLY
ncbi:MAG: hypothetical protein WC680_05010 [Sulfuricurvum sp.]|jgi:hypothetical protein